jgi:hypothetical protein
MTLCLTLPSSPGAFAAATTRRNRESGRNVLSNTERGVEAGFHKTTGKSAVSRVRVLRAFAAPGRSSTSWVGLGSCWRNADVTRTVDASSVLFGCQEHASTHQRFQHTLW